MVKEHGGVTISDEVQTGFNRCGDAYWGFDLPHNKAMPDMITVAKGMGGGVGILGAVICKRSIAEAFTTKMFVCTACARADLASCFGLLNCRVLLFILYIKKPGGSTRLGPTPSRRRRRAPCYVS
jgi:4-aminobutyrate aminotransferase-like enzyme